MMSPEGVRGAIKISLISLVVCEDLCAAFESCEAFLVCSFDLDA